MLLEVTVASRNLHFRNENLNPKTATPKTVSQSLMPTITLPPWTCSSAPRTLDKCPHLSREFQFPSLQNGCK